MQIYEMILDYMQKHPQSPAVFSTQLDYPYAPVKQRSSRTVPERKLRDLAYMIITVTSPKEIGQIVHLPLKGNPHTIGEQKLHSVFITEEHSHNHIELAYIAKGKLHQRIDGEDIYFKEGEFCLIDSNVPHYEFLISDGSIIAYLIFDDIFFAESITQHINDHLNTSLKAIIDKNRKRYRYIRFTPKDHLENLSISTFRQILSEFLSNYPNKEHLIIDYIERLLVLIPREYQMNLTSFDQKEQKQALINDIIGYISENIAEVTVQNIASAYHYHPDYLNRLFREFTGHTISFQIQKLRMEQALTLLLESSLPVQSISNQIGYNNVSFFYRKFKERYLCTPDDIRNQRTANPTKTENK